MQSEEVKAFKNDLRNYTFKLHEIVTLENSIEFLYDRLGGVRGVDPSKEPLHGMPNKDLEYKLRDDITKLDEKLKRKRDEIAEIDQILMRMEETARDAVIDVYVHGKLCDKVARQQHMSPSGLKGRMDRQIKKALQQ